LFRGNTAVNLDEKNRFAIPTRYRDRVRDICACQLIATVAVDENYAGIQGCLWFYPKPEFERVEKEILQMPSSEVGVFLRRFLIGYASDCEMDSQGRILIPESLRTIANLDKKIELVGQSNRLEIWSADEWANRVAKFYQGPSSGPALESVQISF
jgi:MraZ protein